MIFLTASLMFILPSIKALSSYVQASSVWEKGTGFIEKRVRELEMENASERPR
jgi:hypothetical protein